MPGVRRAARERRTCRARRRVETGTARVSSRRTLHAACRCVIDVRRWRVRDCATKATLSLTRGSAHPLPDASIGASPSDLANPSSAGPVPAACTAGRPGVTAASWGDCRKPPRRGTQMQRRHSASRCSARATRSRRRILGRRMKAAQRCTQWQAGGRGKRDGVHRSGRRGSRARCHRPRRGRGSLPTNDRIGEWAVYRN